jgi:predicted ATPase/DNA-binding CsgD family transcriptional regulator
MDGWSFDVSPLAEGPYPESVNGGSQLGLREQVQRLHSPDAAPSNLPDPLTSFVGREREVADVREALAGTRLLTLTGTGGCGKTRLALQVAAQVLERFSGGTWWVELATLSDPALVGPALANAMGVRPLGGQTDLDAAVTHLAGCRALVALDNCEHLLDEVATVAEALLRGCPEVTVLATSRAPLGVPGESDWRVPSLSLPKESAEGLERSDAARLFVERAAKVRPDFRVGRENAQALVEVCHELDGIPLAIELAAGRVRLLSVEQIAAGLGDRFALLTGGARSALPRHRTLRASVDWSHELLDEPERKLLRRLSVFASGFTLEAAEQVCTGEGIERVQILDELASLVEHSLVQAEERAPAVRYRLLETVRQYALERLEEAGELERLRDRHRDAYLALAERVEPELLTPREAECLDLLDAEAANLQAAIEWAADTAPEKALRLCLALTLWWRARGLFSSSEAAYRRTLDAADPTPSALRARALWGRAFLLGYSSSFESATTIAQQALAEAEQVGDESTMARALVVVGLMQMWADPTGAQPILERSRELARRSADDYGFARANQTLAYIYLWQDNHDQIRTLYEELLPVEERLQFGEALAFRLGCLAMIDYYTGNYRGCRDLAGRALEAARAIGDPDTETLSAAWLSLVDAETGEPERGLERLGPAVERALALGAGMALPWSGAVIAQAQAARGSLEEAQADFEGIIAVWPFAHALAWAEAGLAEVLRLQGDGDGAAAHSERAVEVAERIGNWFYRARAIRVLGRLAAGRSEWGDAERLHHQALAMITERGFRAELPDSLEALAEVAAGLESNEEAAALLGAAARARRELGLVAWERQREELAVLTERVREALDSEAFETAWARGADLSADEVVGWVRRARGSRKRPSGGWESLTPTELEVVRHAAAGHTNPEIGERMFISRGTVKTHLSHIYAKLDVRNRSELAAVAMRRPDAE